MFRNVTLLVVVAIAGCGPSARELRERTLSTLNTEADRWEGGKDFDSSATDAYRPGDAGRGNGLGRDDRGRKPARGSGGGGTGRPGCGGEALVSDADLT